MGAPINFTGLTGFDTRAVVDALMEIERRPLRQIENEQALTQLKRSLFQDISSKLSALDSAIGSLNSISSLNAKTASVSNSNALSATATAFAQNGTYAISEITRLATHHSEAFIGIEDKGAQFTSGTFFDFTANGTDYSIDVSALSADKQTLEGLRNAINQQAGDDVTASIINTGADTDNYKLVLRSLASGEDAQITNISTDIQVTTSTGDTTLATVAGEQVLGQDALFTFNGVQISRSSNTVDDLIDGLSFTLKQETTSEVEITVSSDSSALQGKLEAFISSYNELNAIIQDQFTLNPETQQTGPLSGDFTLRQIQSTIQSLVVGGVTDADGNRHSLATIGVEIDKTGQLSLDTEKLDQALADGGEDLVLNLFLARGSASNQNVSYVGSTNATQAGEYSINITGTDGSGNVTGTFTLGGQVYTGVGNGDVLAGPKGSPAEGLKVRIAAGATGDLGTLFFSTGVAEQMERRLNDFLAPITGLLPKLDDSFEEQIKGFNDQIAAFEERLAVREQVLLQQFLAAEDAISALQSQQSAFAAQLQNLGGIQNNSKSS